MFTHKSDSSMKYVSLYLGFLTLIFFDFYLKSNVKAIGEPGVNIEVLALFVTCYLALFIWRLFTFLERPYVDRWPLFFLLLFIVYFAVRTVVDVDSFAFFKAYFVSTSGGVVLFLLLGVVTSFIIVQSHHNYLSSHKYLYVLYLITLAYAIVSFVQLFSVYLEFAARLREDVFLIADANGRYQRPGDFLIISLIILLTVYSLVSSVNQRVDNFCPKWIMPALAVVVYFSGVFTIIIGVMIGSNKTPVLAAGLLVSVFSVSLLAYSTRAKKHFYKEMVGFKRLFIGKTQMIIGLLFVVGIVINTLVLVLVTLITTSIMGVDLTMSRLGGYGGLGNLESLSSVSSRIDLLSNFYIHFSYEPFWGNMRVDCITTGCGSYVHSFMGSLLTHTGMVGFFLMAAFILLAYEKRLRAQSLRVEKTTNLTNNFFNLYQIVLFSNVLLMAMVGTFFTWIIIWFVIGSLLLLVRYKPIDSGYIRELKRAL